MSLTPVVQDDTAARVARLSINAADAERPDFTKMEDDSQASMRVDKRRRRSSAAQTQKLSRRKKLLLPPSITIDNSHKLKILSLRDLIIRILKDQNIQWLTLMKRPSFKKFIFVFVPGLEPKDFGFDQLLDEVNQQRLKPDTDIPFFTDHFEYVIPIQAPGSKTSVKSPYLSLINAPMSRGDIKRAIQKDKERKIYLPDLLMTYDQFIANEYPIHKDLDKDNKFPLPEGWVETEYFKHEGSKTFAMDCEMCLSDKGHELTRVSIVNFNDQVIYDEFVKPKEEIIDYVTQYSGITAELLKDVTLTLEDVQELLLKIISSDDIIIGHSLENDLNLLKIRHPRVIDTSLIYEHLRGPPSKASLKYLAKTYLNKDIQLGTDGHSSVEDSTACLDLVKLKLINGFEFGRHSFEQSIFAKLYDDLGKTSTVIDYDLPNGSNPPSDNTTEHVKCTNDDEVIDNLIEYSNHNYLNVAKLRELEFSKGFSTVPDGINLSIDEPEIAFKKLSNRLEKLYTALPDGSVVIICSGMGNPLKMRSLQNEKRELRQGKDAVSWKTLELEWNLNNMDDFIQLTQKARDAIAFIKVKAPKYIGYSEPPFLD